MELLKRLFGSTAERTTDEETSVNVAFVLLSEARLPDAQQVVSLFHAFASPSESLQIDDDSEGDKCVYDQAFSLKLSTGESCLVFLMPAPVPNNEADGGVQFSLGAIGNQWKLPPHSAHLVVTFRAVPHSLPVVRVSRFTSLLAAVTKAAPSLAVYWGGAGATHPAEFFLSIAAEPGIVSRITLWTGVSIARTNDGRYSLLSLGMRQLGLPDLLLVAGEASANASMEMMLDLLAYVAERGEPLPDGHTVGRSMEERLTISYVESPVNPGRKVWRVETP